MSEQPYGPLVAVPRIIAMLDECGVRATFFGLGVTADRYPRTVERIVAAGHEVAHLDEGAERADYEQALTALERRGTTPVGYRAPAWEPDWRTPELLAEYGLLYDSSRIANDQPYRIITPDGDLIELPPHWSLDDWRQHAWLSRPVIGGEPSHRTWLWRCGDASSRRDAALGVAVRPDDPPAPVRMTRLGYRSSRP